MARKVEGGSALPVCIVEDRSGGGGASAVTLDAAQLASLTSGIAGLLSEMQLKANLTETQPVLPPRRTVAATDTHAPADNTAAVLDYTGVMAVAHVIGQITWSYDADPTGGLITIENSTTVVFQAPITKGGPGQLTFNPPISTGTAQDLTITLAAGGGTVQGTLSATHWLEA